MSKGPQKRTLFCTSEFRAKETESGEPVAEGLFVVFNSPTELYDGYYEQILPEAINLERDLKKNDIAALANHNDSLPLARVSNNTLELWVDEKGLHGRIHFDKSDTEAMNWYSRIKSGVVYQNSFGFIPKKEDEQRRDDGTILCSISDLELLEVSPVTFPAYKDTEIAARKAETKERRERLISQKREKLQEQLKEVLRRQ